MTQDLQKEKWFYRYPLSLSAYPGPTVYTLHDLQHASEGHHVCGFNNRKGLPSAIQRRTIGRLFLTGARTHGQGFVITTNSTVLPEAMYCQDTSQKKGLVSTAPGWMSWVSGHLSPSRYLSDTQHYNTNDLIWMPERTSVETCPGGQTPGKILSLKNRRSKRYTLLPPESLQTPTQLFSLLGSERSRHGC